VISLDLLAHVKSETIHVSELPELSHDPELSEAMPISESLGAAQVNRDADSNAETILERARSAERRKAVSLADRFRLIQEEAVSEEVSCGPSPEFCMSERSVSEQEEPAHQVEEINLARLKGELKSALTHFEEKAPPQKDDPSDTFFEENQKFENTLGKPWEFPASPKNKKKNHARRERRLATQKRLVEEATKKKAREDRLREREEKRARQRANQKLRVVISEGPVLIPVDDHTNQRRLPRSSDRKTYVCRKCQGRIRRIWVQCWVGRCSTREHLKEQARRDIRGL
jgi:hypothetical protein